MYISWTYITDPIWNNEFSYQERIALWSVGGIFVPKLIQWNLKNLEQGSEIVFEEVINNKLTSCTWLKHFVQLEYKWTPVYIVDNHNHALTFWYQHHSIVPSFHRSIVIHIDQHADTKPNTKQLQGSIESFVNERTNVGNFISAALHNEIIDEVVQIRTDYALHHFDISSIQQWNIILDIDVDFRVDKEITQEEIHIIRELIKKAKIVTMATSPYFIDQNKAIEIIKKILAA